MFESDEKSVLVEMIREHLAYCHEMLRDEQPDTATALAVFDGWPEVRALAKIDPANAASLRSNVEAELYGWFGDPK